MTLFPSAYNAWMTILELFTFRTMSTTGLILEDAFPDVQVEPDTIEMPILESSIALLKDEQPIGSFVMITPEAVHTLVERNVHVFMQHGFADHTQYTDMDYANAGVEFVDDFFMLSRMSRTLVKFTPFTDEQIALMKNEQVIFSTQFPSQISAEQIQKLNERKVIALAMNLIKEERGMYMTDKILSETWSAAGVNIALSAFLLPLFEELAEEPRIKFLLQRNPLLMQSAYCYNGFLCNKEIAELLKLPWKDITSLCWEVN